MVSKIFKESWKNRLILAFVGMPGSGKTESAEYLQKRRVPFVRFGGVTDEGLRKLNLPINPQNEQMYREKIRREIGMAAYAILSRPKIEKLLKKDNSIGIDGLYSWEEYTFLKKEFPGLVLIHIFSEPEVRYKRLSQRKVRPLTFEESRARDSAEIEKLNKAGPIAIADYLIDNSASIRDLQKQIDTLLYRLDKNSYGR